MRLASAMSRVVTPPAEWVAQRNVSVRHRMSMSGWWSISSATLATRSTTAIAAGKLGSSTVRLIASGPPAQPSRPASAARTAVGVEHLCHAPDLASACAVGDRWWARAAWWSAPVVRLRVGVHERRGQPGYGVHEPVLGVDGDRVRLDHGRCGVDDDLALGAQPVPDPAQPDRADVEHAVACRAASARPRRPGPGRRRPSAGGRPRGRRRASTTRMATVMSRPTTGSAQRQPSATPPAPSSTASEVKPSVRACSPSATSAAEPIRRPTRDPVAGDRPRCRGSRSRRRRRRRPGASTSAGVEQPVGPPRTPASDRGGGDEHARSTMPARSSARPYP